MRLLSIFVLACLLAGVYFLGATVYSNMIEQDIAERSSTALLQARPDSTATVDGRDVTVSAVVESEQQRKALLSVADNVWGVRATRDNIRIAAAQPAPSAPAPEPIKQLPGFDFSGFYNNDRLHVSGLVDTNDIRSKLDQIRLVLPPNTAFTIGTLTEGSATLDGSQDKVDTGIAALTQLTDGSLKITDTDFILTGEVSDVDRLDAIERLLATRSDALAPLQVTTNITVDDFQRVTLACRTAITNTMRNNTVNYAVNYHQVEPEFAGKLAAIADMVTGVCSNQIAQVLIEGHADVTGGEGYNQGLSERRAASAQAFLEQHGVRFDQISAFGYGEFRPVASNETAYGRSQNRRTEVHITTIPAGADNATLISTFDE